MGLYSHLKVVLRTNTPSPKLHFFSLTIAENFRGYAIGSIIFPEFGKKFKQLSYGFIELFEVFEFLKK